MSKGWHSERWYPVDEAERRAGVPQHAHGVFRRLIEEARDADGVVYFSRKTIRIRGDVLGRIASQAAKAHRGDS